MKKQKNLSHWVTVLALILAADQSVSAASPQPLLAPEATRLIAKELAKTNQLFAQSAAELKRKFSFRDAKGRIHSFFSDTTTNPNIWALKDPTTNGVEGTRTEKAFAELKLSPPLHSILVAVIDSGVDIEHPSLKTKAWINAGEANGKSKVDDDGNGYVDDIQGWNFLGNPDGSDVVLSSLEVSRELGRLSKKEKAGSLSPEERAALPAIKQEYESGLAEQKANLDQFDSYLQGYSTSLEILRMAGLTAETVAAVKALDSTNDAVIQAKGIVLNYLERGKDLSALKAQVAEIQVKIDTNFNPDYDPSQIIGDHPEQLSEIGYGNPHVITETAEHGTHCAGIIAATLNNQGMQGQSPYAAILPIRAIPDGDERDKDVANAVRYAVDQGARVINLSFGKQYSPYKDYVDAAFEYAEKKGVLIVHAAGNESADISDHKNFPNRYIRKTGRELSNWIEVGASSAAKNEGMPAPFSNFSSTSVDLFAPGFNIISTTPGGKYESLSGTSMAAPEVAGIAALILSQHPEMSPADVKAALMKSVRKYEGLQVFKPGTADKIPFESLSISGGIVDAYEALKNLGH